MYLTVKPIPQTFTFEEAGAIAMAWMNEVVKNFDKYYHKEKAK
jgi:hypothetical protein